MFFIILWFLFGLAGAYCLMLCLQKMDNEDNEDNGDYLIQNYCPSPIEILLILVASFAGVVTFFMALWVSLDRHGIFYKPDRFKWWFSPLCGKKK